jgi:hypothetical protein
MEFNYQRLAKFFFILVGLLYSLSSLGASEDATHRPMLRLQPRKYDLDTRRGREITVANYYSDAANPNPNCGPDEVLSVVRSRKEQKSPEIGTYIFNLGGPGICVPGTRFCVTIADLQPLVEMNLGDLEWLAWALSRGVTPWWAPRTAIGIITTPNMPIPQQPYFIADLPTYIYTCTPLTWVNVP